MEFDFDETLILENDRSRLEPLTEEHFSELLPIALAHPDLLRYSPSAFGNEAHLKAYFGAALVAKALEERYPFAIFDKQTQQYAGSTSFGNISNTHQRLEIGWTWITPALQRTGLNRNNKLLMLSYGFETLDFKRIELKSDSRNEQSRRAMEAIGATYEGELRSHTLMPDGFRRSTVYYSILREEWVDVKRNFFS
ncbi:MAG: GNAT family protein [Bacteroidota bacterium]